MNVPGLSAGAAIHGQRTSTLGPNIRLHLAAAEVGPGRSRRWTPAAASEPAR